MPNKYLETGTIFRRSDGQAAPESDVTHAVRKAVADHRRLLQGPHGNMAGKRVVTLGDGTIIVTSVNPFGLVPTLVATVTYPPITKLPEEEFWCEAGLLTWDPLTPYLPLHVYVGDKLKPLLTQKLTDGYYDSHYWLSTRPDIEYPDLASDFYTDTTYWPSFWSGKARLMMQALHAIQRDPKEIFGTNINSNYQGVWEVWPGEYVVAGIGAGGVFVTRLVFPEDASDKANEARAVYLSDDEVDDVSKSLAEACMMSALVVSGDPIELLSADAIAPCLAEGGAMAYGWKFARGKLEASIVTFKETCMPEFEEITCIGQFETSLFTIKADYARHLDQWSATIEHPYGPTRSRPRTGWTSIYVPQYGAMYNWNYVGKVPGWGENPFPACCYEPIGDTIQPQYCFYDLADALQIVWYAQYQIVQETYDTRPTAEQCGQPWERNGEYGTWGYAQGGFKLSTTIPEIAEFRDDYGGYTVETYSIAVDNGGTPIVTTVYPTGSETNFYDAAAIFCDNSEMVNWYQAHSPYIPSADPKVGSVVMTAPQGSQAEALETQTFTADPRLWSFVVAAYDAEAVYILAREKTSTVGEQKHAFFTGSTPTSGGSFLGSGITFQFYSTVGVLVRTDNKSDVSKTVSPGSYDHGSWFGKVLSEVTRDELTPFTDAVTTTQEQDYAVEWPAGTIHLATDAYFPTVFPESILEGTFIEGQPLKCLFSYTGDGLYYSQEGMPVSIGGYPVEPGLGGFFIGGA
jgi:hypothetical protein